MNKKKLLVIFSLLIVLFAGGYYMYKLSLKADANQFLERNNLNDLSVKEIVDKLEKDLHDDSPVSASIFWDRVVIKDDMGELVLPLPDDEFYISIAPYINFTHECIIHSLTGCRGELKNTKIDVEIVDLEGNVIYSNITPTLENGFLGIWLPRDIEAILTVRYNNKVATLPISTFPDSATCLTYLKLE